MSDSDEENQGEAEAQSVETIMPWIWGGVGLLIISAFVAFTLLTAQTGHVIAHPAGVAPLLKPPGQGA